MDQVPTNHNHQKRFEGAALVTYAQASMPICKASSPGSSYWEEAPNALPGDTVTSASLPAPSPSLLCPLLFRT